MRIKIAALGLTGALLLTACSSPALKVREPALPSPPETPTFNLPEIPSIDFDIPSFEPPEIPSIDFDIPSFEPPEIPSIDFGTPSFDPPPTYTLPDPGPTTTLHWSMLQAGQCTNSAQFTTAPLEHVDVFDCSIPHEVQILEPVELGSEWPGEGAAGDMVDAGCLTQVEAIANRHPELAVRAFTVYPNFEAFDYGIHFGLCTMFTDGAPLVGTY